MREREQGDHWRRIKRGRRTYAGRPGLQSFPQLSLCHSVVLGSARAVWRLYGDRSLVNVLHGASPEFLLVSQDLHDDLLGPLLLLLLPIQSSLRSSSLGDDSLEGLRGRGEEGKMRWWWEKRRWAGNKDDGPGTKTMGWEQR